MMIHSRAILGAVTVLLCGCAAIPDAGRPKTEADILARLRAIPLTTIDHRCSSGLAALRELAALARYAERPVHINLNAVEGVVAVSTEQWISERKRAPKPEIMTKRYTGWTPRAPRFGEWVVTLSMRDTNVHEAFTILCEVSGLEWSVDQWMGIQVKFENEEANQLLNRTQ